MGLFDTIFFKAELPLPEELKSSNMAWDHIDFQTKDLRCFMFEYVVTKEGQLQQLVVEGSYVPNPDYTPKKLFIFKDKFQETSRYYKDHNVTETVVFYTNINDCLGYDWWLEFKAEFVEGKMKSINLVECTKEDVEVRLSRERKWSLERDIENNKLHNRIKRYVNCFIPWSRFWRLLASKISNAGMKIDRFIRQYIA
jgi:hypothetical protein